VEDAEGAARAAVAVVLREGDGGLETLLMRRVEDPRDPWSGQMAFPGGREEPGDADLAATAVRETTEEVALDLAAGGELLGRLDQARAMARMRPMNLTITPFVFRLHGREDGRPGGEAHSLHWVPVRALLDPANRATVPYPGGGDITLRFPCVRWNDLVIWGLTYRMVIELERRLAEVSAP
jgi:8-oxo-dGTP pyrophosphatase MutT (NUDIX family)